MTEDPYRWLEAMANRREYVADQLAVASPAFAASVEAGIVLLSVGTGQSKVFEIYDRQAIAALGHSADVETARQWLIDAAHLEGFTRSPDDVSIERLIASALAVELKTRFEQIHTAPVLVELIAAELGGARERDRLIRLRHDGDHQPRADVAAACPSGEKEEVALEWLAHRMAPTDGVEAVVEVFLQVWGLVERGESFSPRTEAPDKAEIASLIDGRAIEVGLLDRQSPRRSVFRGLSIAQ